MNRRHAAPGWARLGTDWVCPSGRPSRPRIAAGIQRLSVLLKNLFPASGRFRAVPGGTDAIRHHDSDCGTSEAYTCGHVRTGRTGRIGYEMGMPCAGA